MAVAVPQFGADAEGGGKSPLAALVAMQILAVGAKEKIVESALEELQRVRAQLDDKQFEDFVMLIPRTPKCVFNTCVNLLMRRFVAMLETRVRTDIDPSPLAQAAIVSHACSWKEIYIVAER